MRRRRCIKYVEYVDKDVEKEQSVEVELSLFHHITKKLLPISHKI